MRPQLLALAALTAASCAANDPVKVVMASPDVDPKTGRPISTPRISPALAVEMIPIPAGPFSRGTPDGQGDTGEQPRRRLFISAFEIDRLEVTVADYRRCVEAGRCTVPDKEGLSCGGDEMNWTYEDRRDHPVNCVSILQARDYCAWLGKRLPTEAEGAKAARGDRDDRESPWSPSLAPACDLACMQDDDLGCGERPSTCPVGAHPRGASPYGVLDMAGNVWEWVSDYYAEDYFAQAVERDPQGPAQTSSRVVRGGSYDDVALYQRLAYRFDLEEPDTFAYTYIGFRCAR